MMGSGAELRETVHTVYNMSSNKSNDSGSNMEGTVEKPSEENHSVGVAELDKTLEGRFDASIFRGLYQRNNKRGGLKNLRCFPSCSTEHRVRGFCGRSVVVTFRRSENAMGSWDPPNQYRAFVEFEEEPFEDRRPPRIPVEEMETLLRTKAKPTNPVIEGKHCFTKDNITVYEFNQERRGWHYSWGSNKHKCDTRHRLLCRLYEVQGNMLVLRARCASPDFVLFCRRRRRFTLEPSATAIAPMSSSLTPKDANSKRQRRTPNQSKFVQEIELLTTVHRIESMRDKEASTSNPGTSEDYSESDEEEDEDEYAEAAAHSSAQPGRLLSLKTMDDDVTEATQALLALTGARA